MRTTGQLVVRYQSPWRRRGLAIVGVLGGVLLLYVIYEWGRFAGGYSKFSPACIIHGVNLFRLSVTAGTAGSIHG